MEFSKPEIERIKTLILGRQSAIEVEQEQLRVLYDKFDR